MVQKRLVNTLDDYFLLLMTEAEFRDRLIWVRSKRGISQQQLAEAAEIAPAQISRYEAGRATPRPQIVAKLATALNVDLEWMLSGRGEPRGDLPPYPGKADRGGWVRIWIPLELFGQLQRAADVHTRPVEVEAAIRLKRSLSTETIPGSVGMQELHSRVEELQRLIRSTIEDGTDLVTANEAAQGGSADEIGEPLKLQEMPAGSAIDGAHADAGKQAAVSTEEKRKITMVKKSHHEVKAPDRRDPEHAPRTIPVEVRKKRTFIKKFGPPKPKP